MATIVERLIAAHADTQFVLATTKSDVLAALDEIRDLIGTMEDFKQFPEGANGAILFALLKHASTTCPDVGDFNYVYQGCQAALNTTFRVLSDEVA